MGDANTSHDEVGTMSKVNAGSGAAGYVLILILGATAAGLVLLRPPLLPGSDAGLLLLDASRLMHGAVPYRDFETYTTPGTLLLQAAAFRWSGWTAQVAFGVQAILQFVLAATTYLISRRLGARPLGGCIAATFQIAMGYPIWSGISAHWFGAVGLALVVLSLSFDWLAGSPARNAIQGFLVGFLICLQHQKGLIFLPILAAYLIADAWLDGRFVSSFHEFARRVLALGLPMLLLVGVSVGLLAHLAGASATVDGLLVSPLVRYKRWNVNQTDVASGITLIANGWFPDPANPFSIIARETRLASIVLAMALIGSIGLTLAIPRVVPRSRARQLLLAVSYCVASEVTSGYRFLIPGYQAMAASAVGVILGIGFDLPEFAPTRVRTRLLRTVFGVCVVLLLLQSAWEAARMTRGSSVRTETPFGSIATSSRHEGEMLQAMIQNIREYGPEALYCHTYCPEVNLVFGLSNPTGRSFLLPGFHTNEEFEGIRLLLAKRHDPFIATGVVAALNPGDPVLAWIRREYQPLPPRFGRIPGLAASILVRKDLAAMIHQMHIRMPDPPASLPSSN